MKLYNIPAAYRENGRLLRAITGLSLLFGVLVTGACHKAAPDAAERARFSRAMDKMETEQAQADVARIAAAAVARRAESN